MMNRRRSVLFKITTAAAVLAVAAGLAGAPAKAGAEEAGTIRPDDPAPMGWATANGGTNGGAGATADSTYVVSNRAELFAALENQGAPDAPKVIYVKGTIRGNESVDGKLLGEQDYAPGYDIEKYLTCFGDDWHGKHATGPGVVRVVAPRQ